MQLNRLQFVIFILLLWTWVECKGYYSILAPGVIRSNRKYTSSLTLHNANSPATIRFGISRAAELFIYQDVMLKPFQTKMITFDLPKLDTKFDYKLIAEGIESLQFKNSTNLLLNDNDALKVYVQTSKGLYKPGDLIKFRVIILNEHLKPIKLNEPVKVEILDNENHRVKQFKNIQLIKGMFSSEFQLSEHPNIGTWKISISISGKYNIQKNKYFKVHKYVLPQFSVHLETVDNFVHEDEILKATIYAKYTFGRYVTGKATVKLVYEGITYETQSKDIENYTAIFNLNVSHYLPNADIQLEFEVQAAVTDKYTNITESIKKTISHNNQPYKIFIPLNEIEFRNNRPYLIKTQVLYLNDTPVIDQYTPIFMQHGHKTYQTILNDQGMASFVFDYENDQTNMFRYKNTSFELSNIFYNDQPLQDTLCNLKVKTEKIQFDKPVEVVFSSKSYIPYFVYVLISHGNIIQTKYVKLDSLQHSYTIKIKPSIEIVPQAVLSVHYLDKEELNYCDIVIEFSDNALENKVEITSSNVTVGPGEEVTFNIRAQPKSRVALMAIDLRSHLLNPYYNINKQSILRDLFDDRSYTPYDNILLGKEAGLVLLTNADIINITPLSHFGIINKNTWLTNLKSKSGYLSANLPVVRNKFPETWIFREIDILNDNTLVSLNIPDSITTWLVTAISINEETGLGMTDESLKITVFRSFFISTNLPYSIKRGEIVAVPLTVYNYYDENLPCEITMNNTENNFRFLGDGNTILNTTEVIKKVNVMANSGASLQFKVKALKLGQVNISLSASSPLASDAVVQPIIVEPEGILIQDNQEIYLNLQMGQQKKSSFNTYIPANIVNESEFLTLAISGDTLMNSLEHLNNLVQMPTGCGEQNMINFAPNILVLDYLKVVDKLQHHKELVAKAIGYIETGYQNELTYRHESGGYSVFGPGFEESTWLTAYVIRFFIKALKYVSIEPEIITSGLDYLAQHQLSNGEFEYTGYLFYPAHQNSNGFTAFVLLTFLESRIYKKRYSNIIQRGLNFLSDNFENSNDTYALAIMALTFQMAGSTEAPIVINKLESMQKRKDNRIWWSATDKFHTNDIEITAYALVSLLSVKSIDHISIFRWLIEQRNGNGGFRSTHETVVGLQALIKFSEQYNILTNSQLNVSYTAENDEGLVVEEGIFNITEDNSMVLQKKELPRTTRLIKYEAVGYGSSWLQFSYQYYITESQQKHTNKIFIEIDNFNTSNQSQNAEFKYGGKKLRSAVTLHPSFQIKPMAKIESNMIMLLDICFEYQPFEDIEIQKTNMIIMNVCLPSGYISNSDYSEDLLKEEIVTKVELVNSDTKVIVYFDQLEANEEHCLHVRANKEFDVDSLKPTSIEMYDYYNENLRGTAFYEINV